MSVHSVISFVIGQAFIDINISWNSILRKFAVYNEREMVYNLKIYLFRQYGWVMCYGK